MVEESHLQFSPLRRSTKSSSHMKMLISLKCLVLKVIMKKIMKTMKILGNMIQRNQKRKKRIRMSSSHPRSFRA